MNKVLVIGDVILDKYTYWENIRENPESTMPLIDVTHDEFRLWWAANVAINIASLTWKCDLLGYTWNDRTAIRIQKLCEEWNVNFINIEVNQHSIIKQRFIDKKTGKQLLRVDYENQMLCNDYEAITKHFKTHNYDIIVISDYNKGVINERIISLIYKNAQWTNIYIDTKKSNLEIFWRNYVLKINEKELQKIVWVQELFDDSTLKESIYKLWAQIKGSVIVTRAEKWCILFNSKNSKIRSFKQKKIKVVDVCWAWDVFLAWLIYWHHNKKSIAEACKKAMKLAWESVTKIWTYTLKIK